MFKRVVLASVVLAIAVLVIDWWLAGRRVDKTTAEINASFPNGITFAAAKDLLRARYTRSVVYSTSECAVESKRRSPAPPEPQGGPCIYGIKEAGTTIWGFKSAISFQFAFDDSNVLVARDIHPVYTFL
jgi:hypothetical protein